MGNTKPFIIREDIEGSILVIPTISIGNVPQLANDLIIQTFNGEKAGSLDPLYLYPFSCPIDRPAEQDADVGVSTAADVFYVKEHDVTIIHQRSPIIPGNTQSYVQHTLLPFIEEFKFKKVFVLCSSDAGMVPGISSGTIRKYSIEDLLSTYVETLNINGDENVGSYDPLPSLVKVLVKCLDTMKINTSFLVCFAYEGDNFSDGKALASEAIDSLGLGTVAEWKKPKSWSGVYGTRDIPIYLEEGLYG